MSAPPLLDDYGTVLFLFHPLYSDCTLGTLLSQELTDRLQSIDILTFSSFSSQRQVKWKRPGLLLNGFYLMQGIDEDIVKDYDNGI